MAVTMNGGVFFLIMAGTLLNVFTKSLLRYQIIFVKPFFVDFCYKSCHNFLENGKVNLKDWIEHPL